MTLQAAHSPSASGTAPSRSHAESCALSTALHCSGFVASHGAFCDVLWSGGAGDAGTNASWAAAPPSISG